MLALPKDVTLAQARDCLAELLRELPTVTQAQVVVDATDLKRFDSSALAVLLEFRRQCLAHQKQFSVRALPPQLNDLAQLYGIAALFPGESVAPVK